MKLVFDSPFDFFKNTGQFCPVCSKQLSPFIDCYSALDATYIINSDSIYFYAELGPKYMIDSNLDCRIKNEDSYDLLSDNDKITFNNNNWYIGMTCDKADADSDYLFSSIILYDNYKQIIIDYELISSDNKFIFNKFTSDPDVKVTSIFSLNNRSIEVPYIEINNTNFNKTIERLINLLPYF